MTRRPFLAALAALLFGVKRRAPDPPRVITVTLPPADAIVIHIIDPTSRAVINRVRYELNRDGYLRRSP